MQDTASDRHSETDVPVTSCVSGGWEAWGETECRHRDPDPMAPMVPSRESDTVDALGVLLRQTTAYIYISLSLSVFLQTTSMTQALAA